jgi:transcriptional regulator with XRE-family HTH domain
MSTYGKSLQEILAKEYELRASRNPKYSLRAFAKSLGISQSRLSQILKGRQGLSRNKAELIADRLGYGAEEKERLCDIVTAAYSRVNESWHWPDLR